MRLRTAFDIKRGDVVAFIGAGGKTSTLLSLGYELQEEGWRVLATTTTRIGSDQLDLFPASLRFQSGSSAISQALADAGMVFVYDSIRADKVYGPSIEWTRQILDSVDSDVLLVEADGARGLPLKAMDAHEPVIPADTSLVISLASLGVLDRPLNAANVYNVEAIVEKYGFPLGMPVRAPWVAQVMRDDDLGLRGIPVSARVIAYLNQTAERGYGRSRARMIARSMLKSPRFSSVAIGSVRAAEPVYEIQRKVGAIVLAAGASSRMGQPKVLLPWEDGRTIIEHILEQLVRARVDPIVVVTGHHADAVRPLAERYDVRIAHNRSYRNGEMLSSLKAGLRAMPSQVSAALIVLGDQPRIQPRVVFQLLQAYAMNQGEIIAPSFEHRRGHPILIDRKYWKEFIDLPRTGAPRDVINTYKEKIAYVEVETDSVLRDIDTPSDYEAERQRAGLRKVDLDSL